MAYAYAVNKNSSAGSLTDDAGRFTLQIKQGDTLAFSYLGYSVTKFFTHLLKDSVKNSVLYIKAYLKPKVTELTPAIIVSHSISKEARELYEGRIREYRNQVSNPFSVSSTGAGLNIDALYYMFSKKGKELQKLSAIYQQLLIDEMKEKRISSEKLRVITGNDTLDTKDFLNYCYLPDQFVLSASDYDLFIAVKNYYRAYMEMHRRKQ